MDPNNQPPKQTSPGLAPGQGGEPNTADVAIFVRGFPPSFWKYFLD